MARGINKVILVGNLGQEPDIRHTQNGTAVTTISVATSESWTDKQSGQRQERTEWHRVKFFGRLAEIAGEYLQKGRQVYIEGSIRTEKYTDKSGIERWSTEIIANEMQMLGGRDGDGGGREASSGRGRYDQGGGRNEGGSYDRGGGGRDESRGGHQAPSRSAPRPQPAMAGGIEDDDIPF